MIRFACHCNHVFDLPEDAAGRQIQCPECHRLVDVPTHNELAQLSEDGTFKIDDPVENSPDAFERMRLVYAKKKVDDDGLEVDLRQTHEDFQAAGTEDNPNEFEIHPSAPKYDPDTGELVRPLDIAANEPLARRASETPLGVPALNYAVQEPAASNSLAWPVIAMLNPINLAAMFFVLLAHIFFFIGSIIPFVMFAMFFVLAPALVAHYANVVEEIGIEEQDELPRFLRQLSFVDDIWLPFVHIFFAWMICFGPGRILGAAGMYQHWAYTPRFILGASFDIVGLVFFPAVVLTTVTSGSIMNLRPDRVLGVIAAIGPRYAYYVILYPIAFFIYALGFIGTPARAFLFITNSHHIPVYFSAPVAWTALVVGIFLMHYFAWLLGICYRNLHPRFPWIFHQYHREIPGVTMPRYAKSVHTFPAAGPRTPRRNKLPSA